LGREGFEPSIPKYNDFQNHRNKPLCHPPILKAEKGIEPLPGALQALTLPLCDSAMFNQFQDGRIEPTVFRTQIEYITNYATPCNGIDRIEPTMP
jgi:hypothetical protein